MIRLIIIFYFFVVCILSAQKSGDFLIVENPQALVILNKFKQPIDNTDKFIFTKNKPLFITNIEGLLNDGVRAFTEIEVNNNKYYLLKEIKGKYYGEQNAGFIQKYFNKRFYYDTLKILSTNGNTLFDVDKKNKKSLNIGDLLVRVFEDNNLVYVKLPNNNYGWLKPGINDVNYKIVKTEKKRTENISPKIVDDIIKKFEYANKLNEKIYTTLNKLKNKKNIPPKWKVTVTDSRIIATLNKDFEKFGNSNKQLVNKLETIVIGTGLKVILNKNNIEIVAK
jgi:hypothetical protein